MISFHFFSFVTWYLQRNGFMLGSAHVGFVVDNLALAKGFLSVL
jgi:hypothetical protein